MAALSRRERRLILGAVAVAAIIGAWFFAVEPVVERSRVGERNHPCAPGGARAAPRTGRAQGRHQCGAERHHRQDRHHGRTVLHRDDAAVAASELQKLVKDTAGQVRTEVRSERILPPVEHGEILEIPIEITVSGEIRQLVDLLSRLEAAPKLLSVQDLKLRVVNVSQPKELLATVTLSGFILTGRG